jgi:hypothetical protein
MVVKKCCGLQTYFSTTVHLLMARCRRPEHDDEKRYELANRFKNP